MRGALRQAQPGWLSGHDVVLPKKRPPEYAAGALTTDAVVLAVADQAQELELIQAELRVQGFAVVTACGAKAAISAAVEQGPDIVILDDEAGGSCGVDLMRKLQVWIDAPFVLLTPPDSVAERVLALESGADDSLEKPFTSAELAARLRAVLRRVRIAEKSQRTIRIEDIEIDLARRAVKSKGKPVSLTRTEWRLLRHLALNAGTIVLKEELMREVWGQEYEDAVHYLRIWIARIRRRLKTGSSDPVIRTVHGVGYMLDA